VSATLVRDVVSTAPGTTLTAVVKRDGRVVPWDADLVTRAIALAFHAELTNDGPNPHARDAGQRYGISRHDFATVLRLTEQVENAVGLRFPSAPPQVEQVQDIVEMLLAANGHWNVAKRYVLYRAARAERRLRAHGENGLQDYIFLSRYARYRPELGRRETWPEAVARVFEMHRRRFASKLGQPVGQIAPSLGRLLDDAEAAMGERGFLPSMRALQFGGVAVEANNARLFNCSFTHVDRLRAFQESLFLLLSGTGVGFSVQKQHVAKLPPLAPRPNEHELPVVHHTIGDTIEGWSDALGALLQSYVDGTKIEFSYSAIRPRGTPLRTSGGRAPGHLPLKKALVKIEGVLDGAAGRSLRPIEAYDILMHAAVAVLAGGIRRSATICLFSADDDEMAAAKTGNWFETNPQRGKSNNSAVLVRDTATPEQFARLFEHQKAFGEPGFYFTADAEYGANPCVEIGLAPFLQVTEGEVEPLRAAGYTGALEPGERLSGWQMCNLTTINASKCTTRDEFLQLCRYASLMGTLQASYTDIPYLGPVSRRINEREALLGVSICGILDRPDVLLDPESLEAGAATCRETNEAVAAVLGIEPAARITCVKPEGTASLLLGAGSGIHPHHARHYFRRVQAARTDPVFQFFKSVNPAMTETSVWDPETTDVITFPVEAPEGALLREELGAIDFLDRVRLVQHHWVQAGRGRAQYNPGLEHNVSNTVTVRDEEWEAVRDYIWKNRASFTGISLLRATGDKVYPQAPREEVTTETDVAKWNALHYTPMDYTKLNEHTDETTLADVVACAGGACEVTFA
jgi:ribonucleoside-triphosphate reductase (thioredoxin)